MMRQYGWALAVAAMMAFCGPAFGHAKLLSTVPAANATVAHAPGVVTLTFDEEVKLAKFSLARGGVAIPIALDPQQSPVVKYDIAVPALQPGNYTVSWSALTVDDGHVVRGSFSFIIQGAAN